MERETFFKAARNSFLILFSKIIENNEGEFEYTKFKNLDNLEYGPVNKAGIKEIERETNTVSILCRALRPTIFKEIIYETTDGNLFVFKESVIRADKNGDSETSLCISDPDITYDEIFRIGLDD